MGKTRAQYQREYRERKKQFDKDFLKKERQRTSKYKLPIAALSEEKQQERKEKNRIWKRLSRENIKKRAQLLKENEGMVHDAEIQTENNGDTFAETSENPTQSTSSAHECQALTVKLDFKHRSKKRRSKALREASRKIQDLEEKVITLARENKKLRKRNERLIKKSSVSTSTPVVQNEEPRAESTPKSKANTDIRELGLTPRKVSNTVRKKLVMANAMFAEIKSSKENNKTQGHTRVVANIVSGNILRKYKCIDMMSKETNISRKVLKKANTKQVTAVARRRKVLERERIKKRVISFMERDDVSVNMPGKNDCKKVCDGNKSEKQQTRVLTDYLSNLYEKFISENPDIKLSKAVFCRLRPSNILLTKLITRNTCLCSKHQNIAMKLKCIRSLGIEMSPNPETVSKKITEDEMKTLLNDGLQETDIVEFEEWKRVDVDGKKKMKIVKSSMTKDEFTLHMVQQYKDFLHHTTRVKTQYTAIRGLKTDLPEKEVLVHMDFAENFTCSNADEVQSAYWNSTVVTLHPVVVYYRNGEDLEHKNFIFVSDVTNHNAIAVYTILKKLVPELKRILPNLKVVHYWTDSPSSQYRNKYIIDIVQHHTDIFGIEARWNYFESGHGKGPCDGLGGVAKRQAGEACKQGKVNIQDATDFFVWASKEKKSIEYVFYTEKEYDETAKELDDRNPKTLPGTMKLHALFPVGKEIYTAEVSCYCHTCLAGEPCGHWKAETIKEQNMDDVPNVSMKRNMKRKPKEAELDMNNNNFKIQKANSSENDQADLNATRADDTTMPKPVPGKYVLVSWNDVVYPAKIIDVDSVKQEARVSFMEESRRKGDCKLYRWPDIADVQLIEFEDIVHEIEEPSPCSRSRRQFKLQNTDYSFINSD